MAQSAEIKYSVVEGWEQLPKGWAHRDVAGVAVDGEDRVFLICRGDHPVLIYDRQGNFQRSWGEGEFSYRTHGIYVAPNGSTFCTDDGNHTVRQFTPEATAPGSFAAPHGLALDSKNDLYVSEVTWTFAVSRGRVAEDCHTFQKFSLK